MIESKEIANPKLENLKKVISKVLLEEFTAQGHTMTGAVVKDIEYQKEYKGKSLILTGKMYPYGMIVQVGVTSDKIPYDPTRRTGAGTSKYIQALIQYAKQRMGARSEQSAKSIAFAIARTHKKDGMPTKGSYKFSKTGKRKDWIMEAMAKKEDEITEAVREVAFEAISVTFDLIITKYQRELNPESNGTHN